MNLCSFKAAFEIYYRALPLNFNLVRQWRRDHRSTSAPGPGFTFGGCGGRERVHVWGLPALHNRFPHYLQMRVGLIVAGGGVMPGRLAVLSLWEYRLSSGGHGVLTGGRWRRWFWWTVWQTAAPHKWGWQASDKSGRRRFIRDLEVLTRAELLWGRRPRSFGEKMLHSVANAWLGDLHNPSPTQCMDF